MKKALTAMIIMFLLIVWPCGGLWGMVLIPLIGGSVEQTFIYPIYAGIILLAGLIVGCTEYVVREIRLSKNESKES